MEIIDAYSHCGLKKYEPIEKVEQVLATVGVSRVILVQHMGEFDNSYLGGIAARDPQRFASVCLVDHMSPNAGETLRALATSGHFKGVRFPAEVCSSAPHVFRAAVESGLIIVLFVPDGIAPALPSLLRCMDESPEASLVLTHLGNPRLEDGPKFTDARQAFRLAEYPGVHYQVSGMKMFCPYPHDPLHGLVAGALDAFGTSRVYWGSNYPVVGDVDDYRRDLSLVLDGKLPIPSSAIPDIVGGNARQLWFG